MEKKILLNVLKYLKCFFLKFFFLVMLMLQKTLKEHYIFIILQTL